MELKNVTVETKANIYFDGKVNSRTIILENGERLTLGFMQPGEYTFNTGEKELMEVLGGEMTILLPGETEWRTVKEGERFEVPANNHFDVKIMSYADYSCAYITE